MSHKPDADRYVKDPGLLIELCREVIEQLDSGHHDSQPQAMEAQLQEISKAIDHLQRQSVSVPDAFRAEKTRLIAALGTTGTALHHLAEGLEEILKDLQARLSKGGVNTGRKGRGRRSYSPKKDRNVLREHILRALKKFDGKARKRQVIEEMGRQLRDELLSGDLELRQDGKTVAWKNNAAWERARMVREGVLKSGSPKGVWELTETHK